MKKLPWAALALVATAASANLLFAGCGSEDDPIAPADDGGSETTTTPPDGSSGTDANTDPDGGGNACEPLGEACKTGLDCCTGHCLIADGGTGTCASPVAICKAAGAACTVATECCTGSCVGGKCSDKQCVADNGTCTINEECCGQTCTAGKCAPLTTTCKSEGNPCTGPTECCSKQCNANGFCGNDSFCSQTGDICASDLECCGGICNKAAGATYGLCGVLPSAGGCEPAGVLCGSGVTPSACDNKCCSKACGPWGTSGARVCQPPSGCKPEYEVCGKAEDCCGGPTQPQGKAPTTCSIPAGETAGRCTKANTCDPPGGICKLGACGVDNRCCDPIGAPSPSFCQQDPANCCKYDALGIPRCIVSVLDCGDAGAVAPGTTCATSADCCGKPCVNNKCEGTCVASGGMCTTAADCCPGLPCTNGKCGGTVPGTDAGTTTPDGGKCALYGQTCSVAGDCCNGVPCTSGTCRYP